MEPGFKTDARLLPGCVSRLWLAMEFRDAHCWFYMEAEAMIAKGIAAVVCGFYQGETPTEILANEPDFLAEAGLTQVLPANRSSALANLRKRIRAFAEACLAGAVTPVSGHFWRHKAAAGLTARVLVKRSNRAQENLFKHMFFLRCFIAGSGGFVVTCSARAAEAAEGSGWHATSLGQAIGYMVLFAAIGIILAVAGYKIFDKCTPGDLHREIIENRNVAAAILGGAIILGVCVIIAAAMLG